MRPTLVSLSIFLLSSFGGSACAADWTTLPGSTLGFSSTFQGEAFEGKFSKFTPQIRFDPGHLADSRFDVRISLGSADTRNQERDDMLRGADFFDAKKLPEARFVANKFRALGGNRYVADGVLSLHGVSKPVALNFSWTPGAKPVLAGEASLKRLDFAVGGGDWTDTDLLPNEVKVKTRLLLAPAPAAK
jgi:polyisoprenoid-binding protein YceI